MIFNKQKILIAVIIGSLFSFAGLNSAYAIDNQYSNQLLKVNVEKDAKDKKINITLYSSKPYSIKLHPRHVSNNEYVILLPETYHSITTKPAININDGSIKDIDIKLIPYMGTSSNNGYTKIIIKTADTDMDFAVNNKFTPVNNNIDEEMSSLLNDKVLLQKTAQSTVTSKIKTPNPIKVKIIEPKKKSVLLVNDNKSKLIIKNAEEKITKKLEPSIENTPSSTIKNSLISNKPVKFIKPVETIISKIEPKVYEKETKKILVHQEKTQPIQIEEKSLINPPIAIKTETAKKTDSSQSILGILVVGLGLILSILFVVINKMRLKLKSEKETLAKKDKAVKDERKQTSEQILSRLSQSKTIICSKSKCMVTDKAIDPVNSFNQKENHALYERFHEEFSENEIEDSEINSNEQNNCHFYEVENDYFSKEQNINENEIYDSSCLTIEAENHNDSEEQNINENEIYNSSCLTIEAENHNDSEEVSIPNKELSVILALDNLINSLQINAVHIDLLEDIVRNNSRFKNNEDLLDIFIFKTLQKGQNLFLDITDTSTLSIYLNKIAKKIIIETLKEYKRL